MNKINNCSCGSAAEFIKLFESKRYDGFIRCTKCGKEGRTYTSKQNAIQSWNKMNPMPAGGEEKTSQSNMKEGCNMKEIVLPEHEDMKYSHICPYCEGIMLPCTTDSTFPVGEKEMKVSNIKGYKCAKCGEIIFTSAEAKLIEEALRPYLPQENMMTRSEMIAFMKANPYVRISHHLFEPNEYIYSAKDGCIYDENGYLFENWEPGSHANDGIRLRAGGAWENGWRVVG